jgi:glycosyltransferase involved in cell wall biosynthesis
MRLAFFSPMPPQKSGIANYSMELLPHLSRLANVTLYVDNPAQVDPVEDLEIRAVDSFRGLLEERVDMCLYQMGNNTLYHRGIYETLLMNPGVTVLHDLNLYAFHDDLLVRSGNRSAYLREMGYESGMTGLRAGRKIFSGSLAREDERFPLLARIGDVSLGIITHSHYARRYVSRQCPNATVMQINQPRNVSCSSWQECQEAAVSARLNLGYSDSELLIGSFGYAAHSKRIHVVLQALAELREDLPGIRYAVVGAVIDGYDVQTMAAEMGLDDIVRFVGYADDDLFVAYLHAVDIGINLRHPTTGETSAALLSMMAAAKPCLVSNVDAFEELPDDACLKIAPDTNELSELVTALSRLAEETELRHEVGSGALRYVACECAPPVVAQRTLDFLRSTSESLQQRTRWPL